MFQILLIHNAVITGIRLLTFVSSIWQTAPRCCPYQLTERSFLRPFGYQNEGRRRKPTAWTRPTFSRSVMGSVGVSKLGWLLSILSSRVSRWMENTIATTYLDRSCCQTCAGYPRSSSLCFNSTAPQNIEHATPSLSCSERHPTSYLRRSGRLIRQISTRSTTASGVFYRRKFTAPK